LLPINQIVQFDCAAIRTRIDVRGVEVAAAQNILAGSIGHRRWTSATWFGGELARIDGGIANPYRRQECYG